MFGGKSGQKPMAQDQPTLTAIRLQTSVYGSVVPILFGQNRISGKLLWYGDYTAIPHAQQLATGGKKMPSSAMTQITYTYTAAVAIALCQGPISHLSSIWDTKSKYSIPPVTLDTSIPGTSPYQISVGVSQFMNDLGVAIAAPVSFTAGDFGDPRGPRPINQGAGDVPGFDFVPMTKVTSSPTAGQYSVDSTGLYTFSSADHGKQVTITYEGLQAGAAIPLNQFGLLLFTGSKPQTPWSYLTSKHAGQDLAYVSIAYVAAQALDLGASGSLPNLSYEVAGLNPFGGGITDANPKDILYTLLTDSLIGAGWATSAIGDLTAFSNYCVASGIFLSPVLDTQQSASDILGQLFEITNSEPVWSGGQLKVVPYGDQTLVGNGATYVPATSPIYDLGDDDFLADNQDPVTVTSSALTDAYNAVSVEYVDRTNAYNPATLDEKDQAAIEAYGLVPAQPKQYHSITTQAVAAQVAQLQLRRTVYVRNTYTFKLGWQYCLLEPMDLVTLTDAGLGLNKTPVRITSIEEDGNGNLTIEAEEFPWGTASATLYPKQSGSGFVPRVNALPGPANFPFIFEPNDKLTGTGEYEMWMAVSGASADWGGCTVWMSTDGGSTYTQSGRILGKATMGLLSATLPSASDPDNTNALSVDLSECGGTLNSVSATDRDAFRSLCFVDYELIGYETATLTAPNQYNLTGLRRGVYGSPIASHAAGLSFARLDGGIFSVTVDAELVGKPLYWKFTSFNTHGLMEESLADVTAYAVSLSGWYNNSTQIIGNDATVDYDPATPTTVRAYGTSGGVGSTITLKKSDGNVRTTAGVSFTGQSLSTTYWVMYNAVVDSKYLLTHYGDVIAAVGNGHIALGVVTTPSSGGTGGVTGGGGGTSGGAGGNGRPGLL